MDDTDRAQAAAETLQADAIQRQLARRAPILAPTGECLNILCGLPVLDAKQLFCNATCAKAHSKINK